jgi:toxin YoeB
VRDITWSPEGWDDLTYWMGQDRKSLRRIVRIIEDIQRTPAEGIGKPEPLKGNLSGYWSRRIDDTNRIVYRFDDKAVKIIKARFHYSDH